ncbi:MAG: phage tail protein [Pseudomonadota bacterium]
MSSHELAPHAPGEIQRVPGDLAYLEEVVRVNFPVQEAKAFLRRHMGNVVRFRLVEARRGERVGHVRLVEVQPAAGGEPMVVRARRVLPDGSPAASYTPEELVHLEPELMVAPGHQPFAITPQDVVVLHVPVRGYTRYLPAIFQGNSPTERRDVATVDELSQRRLGLAERGASSDVSAQSAEAFRRFLFIFQHLMTTVVDKVEGLPSLTDPINTDPRFLPWIASWVNFEFDAALSVHEQRELVRRAIRLYRMRGTRVGVEEMISVLTAAPVTVIECAKPAPAVLGGCTLSGGPNLPERYLRVEPPAYFLYPRSRPATRYFVLELESRSRFERRFGERATDVLRRISRIVTTEKPAHVQFTIRFADET